MSVKETGRAIQAVGPGVGKGKDIGRNQRGERPGLGQDVGWQTETPQHVGRHRRRRPGVEQDRWHTALAQTDAAEVAALVAETGAAGAGDMGKVMAAAKARFAGRAEMGLVSAAVKAALAR